MLADHEIRWSTLPGSYHGLGGQGACLRHMAKRKIEEQLDGLGALRAMQPAEAVPELRKALAGRIGVVIGKAAKIAAELQARELIPELVAAFERLFESPVERDPQCLGKTGVAK